MDTAVQDHPKIEIRRRYNASKEAIFKAWTDPEALAKWMGPTNKRIPTLNKYELSVGGEYRFRMNDRDPKPGEPLFHVVGGSFVAIEPPILLSFTWQWLENGMDVGETLVTVELFDSGDQAELVLTHEQLPTAHARQLHTEGWEGCLNCLDQYLHHGV